MLARESGAWRPKRRQRGTVELQDNESGEGEHDGPGREGCPCRGKGEPTGCLNTAGLPHALLVTEGGTRKRKSLNFDAEFRYKRGKREDNQGRAPSLKRPQPPLGPSPMRPPGIPAEREAPGSGRSRNAAAGSAAQALHCTPRGAAQALALPLLALLLCSAALCPAPVLGQQSPPLQGQGVPPCSQLPPNVNATEAKCPTKVFISVELLKLLDIDDQNYQFSAVMQVQQSWYDPRAEATMKIVDAADLLKNGTGETNVYLATAKCAVGAGRNAALNLTSEACEAATRDAPVCHKYCTTYGERTDNPFRCCDALWLPDITMPNLIDTTQDRIVFDYIDAFRGRDNLTYVRRVTRLQGRFFSPLRFQEYPFDTQRLFAFLEVQPVDVANFLNYKIIPSATFRHLNPEFKQGPSGAPEISGFATDELAGWNIDSFTFDCTRALDILDSPGGGNSTGGAASGGDTAINPVRLWQKSQDFDPSDPYADYIELNTSSEGPTRDLVLLHEELSTLSSTCALVIAVSRLSSTLVVQSIMPVAFVGGLAFVVFFSAPEALDLRLSTEISLFLALTAVQFIFAAMLPLTSYLTAFDVFILLTYCTIVAIVIENLVVYYIVTREENHERRSRPRSMRAEASLSTRDAFFGASEYDISGCVGGSRGDREGSRGDLELGAVPGKMPLAGVSEEDSQGEEGLADAAPLGLSNGQEGVGLAGNESTKSIASEGPDLSRKRALSKSIGIKPIAEKIKATDRRFAYDSAYAYRVTCRVDVAAGMTILFIYILLSILNFTVGFS